MAAAEPGASAGSSSTTSTAAAATSDVTRRMVCGGLAGMIAKTATNPLDRIRMLSQTGEHGSSSATTKNASSSRPPSVVRLYRDILQREGVIGLWAGNGANLLRVFPAKAVVFSSNDFFRQVIATHILHQPAAGTPQLSGWWSFAAGGLAGMSATLATYPLDLARGRITGKLALAPGQKTYGGILQTVALTVKDEGLMALYRGATPTILGAVPYEGIKFGTVGLLEKLFPLHPDEDGSKPSPWRKMMFGGLGGMMAGLLTYPNDTVRRLLQLQGSRGTTHQFKGYFDCVVQTYRAHGIGRFYNGLTLNIIQMAPNTAVQFGSYELLKQWTADWF